MNEEKELPEGWVRTSINSVARVNPGSDTSALSDSTLVSFIPMAAVEAETGRIDTSTLRELSEVRRGYTAFRENDVIFAKITPCMENGKAAVARSLSSGIGFGSTEFHVLRPEDAVNPQLLYYYVSRTSYRQAAQACMGGSAGQLRVPANFLADSFFPLPPMKEQQRIVLAIEERFTILDAVTTALQQNKQKLKLARASVLKHAVEGKLTEKWRAEHPATESGSELLGRILAERRAKWETEQLAKGKDPRKLRYEEPAELDVSELPELPEEWCWATVEQACERIVDCLHSTPKFTQTGFPCVDSNCIKPGRIVYEKIRYVDEDTFIERNRRIEPQEDDVIFSREGALLGIAVRVPTDFQFCLGQRMMLFRLEQGIKSRYYENTLNSLVFRSQYVKQVMGTAAPHLNIQDIRNLCIPLPPLAEQQQIVAEVERRLSVIEQAEAAIETSLKRIERARQSILERAFSGRLVPQDPNDEPASVLLERIQEERTRRAVDGKQRGRNGGVKAARGKKAKEQDFVPQWQLLRDAQQSGSVDGSLGNGSVHEDGAKEKNEMGQGKMDKEGLGDLVQMPLLWD